MPTFEGHEAEPVSVDITWETPPRQVAPTGAYGPRGGIDWQNLGVVWPFALLPPHHPLVDSSLDRWRHAYVEGAYTYPRDSDYGQLHNYNGMCLSGTWLRRGDWAETVRDLYGTLLHTSSSHASAEVCDSRGRWDYGCTPHNWFSGRYVRFMRDCLVHEDGGTLRLLAGLSPAWMSPGAEIAVEDLPTALGPLSLRVCFRADGLDLTADWRRRPAAQALVLHLPPFLSGVKALGARRVAGGWRVPVVNGRLRVAWTPAPLPDLSFARVLAAWQSDHRRRRAVLGGAP